MTHDIADLFKESYRMLTNEATAKPDYFSSYESCYAILAEVSLEELQEDARKLGINTEGKDKYQIAKLVYKWDDNVKPDQDKATKQ